MKKIRRGFYKDLAEIFAAAYDMVGGTFPPDEMDDARARVRALEKETLSYLRERKAEK